jgi:hypothetical protein
MYRRRAFRNRGCRAGQAPILGPPEIGIKMAQAGKPGLRGATRRCSAAAATRRSVP